MKGMKRIQVNIWRRTDQLCGEKQTFNKNTTSTPPRKMTTKPIRRSSKFETNTLKTNRPRPAKQYLKHTTDTHQLEPRHDHDHNGHEKHAIVDTGRPDPRAHPPVERAQRLHRKNNPWNDTKKTHVDSTGERNSRHGSAVFIRKRWIKCIKQVQHLGPGFTGVCIEKKV